jgi:hypothetical protein
MLWLKYIFDAFMLILAIFVLCVLIVFLICRCDVSSHVVTESSPEVNLKLEDIQYKGHTYIYVKGSFSRTIVHAAHCKCKNK